MNSHEVRLPSDLKAEHDRLMHKRNKEIEREKLEERIRQAKKHEKAYRKLKGIFFGMPLRTSTFRQVRVLESVRSLQPEGRNCTIACFQLLFPFEKNSPILSRNH